MVNWGGELRFIRNFRFRNMATIIMGHSDKLTHLRLIKQLLGYAITLRSGDVKNYNSF